MALLKHSGSESEDEKLTTPEPSTPRLRKAHDAAHHPVLLKRVCTNSCFSFSSKEKPSFLSPNTDHLPPPPPHQTTIHILKSFIIKCELRRVEAYYAIRIDRKWLNRKRNISGSSGNQAALPSPTPMGNAFSLLTRRIPTPENFSGNQ